MGYRKQKKVYHLIFEDDEFEGLEVRTHAPPFGFLEEVTQLAAFAGKTVFTADDMEQVQAFFGAFSKHLISWNLEDDDGTPVPATLEGLRAQELPFVMAIIQAWVGIGKVSGPLVQPSSGGRPSLEGSLPMEALSPSRLNLSGPSLSSAAVSGLGASRVS